MWLFFSANVIYWASSVTYVKSWASKTKQTNSKQQAGQGNTWAGRILFILNSSISLRNFCSRFHRAISALLYFALFSSLGFILLCCIRCGEREKNTKKLQIFHATWSLQEQCFFCFLFFSQSTFCLVHLYTIEGDIVICLKKDTISGIETKWGYPVSFKRVTIWPCVSALSPFIVSKATYLSRICHLKGWARP